MRLTGELVLGGGGCVGVVCWGVIELIERVAACGVLEFGVELCCMMFWLGGVLYVAWIDVFGTAGGVPVGDADFELWGVLFCTGKPGEAEIGSGDDGGAWLLKLA